VKYHYNGYNMRVAACGCTILPGERVTAMPRKVNCARCRQTQTYKSMMRAED
jgi:hypothetical protein